MGEHDVEGRTAARAAALQQGRLEPAPVLIGAFEIQDAVLARRRTLRLQVGPHLERERMRRARVEPDVENVVHLLVVGGLVIGREEARAVLVGEPGIGALLLEGVGDALVHALVLEHLARLLMDEHRDRHAPGALARDHPVGLRLDHAVDAVLAGARHPLHGLDAVERALAQRVARPRDVFIHRDEPLRRIAEDHRLLRAPGMRILMLQPPARDQHAGIDQRLDHRLVGIALLALVGEHALALEARRFLGEAAVGVDGEGDARLDAARRVASRHSRSRYRSRRGHGPVRVCTKPVPSSSVTWSPSSRGT